MTDLFSFFEVQRNTEITVVAISLSILLLLPARPGYRRTIITQEAFAQFNIPLSEEDAKEENGDGLVVEEEEVEEEDTMTATTTTTTTTPTDSFSNLVSRIYLDGGVVPVIDYVPMTLSMRGQTLAIENIDVEETTITDPRQRGILSIIDGQTIYGIVI